MKTKILTAFALSIIFLSVQTTKAQPGCPSIDAGPDQTLDCATSCTNLTSSVLATGTTTSYAVSSIPYAPPYPYNTGTPILVNVDDIWGGVINLPFTFCFWGTNYTQIVAGSNGCISFGPTNASAYCAWSYTVSCPNASIISGSTGPYVLGPYHDIDPSVSGNMYYAILGTYPCRTFVINWNQVAMFSCNSLIATHQIVLYESTNVVEVYMQNKPTCGTWNGGRATLGIQNATGTLGVCPPGRNTGQWTTSNEAWRFTPDGIPNYNTYWYMGGNLIATNTPTINVCPTATTSYVAQVVYDCCTGLQVTVNDTVNVTVANSIGLTIDPAAPAICLGSSSTLTSACTDPTATYQWSTGSSNAVITVTPTTTTTYTVTATTPLCTTNTSVTVSVNPNPPTTASNNSPICAGSDLNLTYPEAGDTYIWSGPNGFSDTGQNPVIPAATTAASGTYSVTITSTQGCTSIAQTTATVNPLPVATASSNSPVCSGTALHLTSGGGTSYSWIGPNSYTSAAQNPTINGVTIAAAGTYTVTVTGTGGCTSTNETVVVVNATPTATASSNSPICAGDTLNLSSGGGDTYHWSGPNTFSSSSQNPVIMNATTAASGNYIVTVTNANGCTATAQVSVTVNPLPAATASSNTPVCFGHTLNLNSGGGTSYIWTGPDSFSSSTQNPSIPNVTLLASGTYLVTVTGVGGCTSTTQTTVVINPNPTFTSVVDSVNCHGGNTGSITLTPSGGTQPYTYTWNPLVSTNYYATLLMAGTYHVTITDSHLCDTVGIISVYQPQDIILTIVPTNENCQNSCDGNINLTATGGTGSFSYHWSGPNAFTASTQDIDSLCTGVYSVTATDANGCVKMASAPIATSWYINAGSFADDTLGVYPFTVNFTSTSTGASIYSWNFGDPGSPNNFSNLQNPSHTYQDSGHYQVWLYVNSGFPFLCTDSIMINIEVIVPSQLEVPNVFTPNGDGKNDEFKLQSQGVDVFNCAIFNRWGKQIFYWEDITKGWDGKTTGGQNASDGVYYYILYAIGYDDIEYNQHGTVTLFR
jgi:large repetitive protein